MKTSKINLPSTLLCDFYKVSHKDLYPKNTEVIYSTFTPRSNKYFPIANGAVVFGIQAFVKKYLIEYFNESFFSRTKQEVLDEYIRVIKFTLGVSDPDASHIGKLHDLGYLPIKISALKEGTIAPIKVPVLTVENTHKDFFWLTNYLETLISTEIWLPMTSATTAYHYRKLLNEFAIKTTGGTDGVDYQLHDFSMRGMASLESAMASGAGHLLSSYGTDTIPAILYHEEYYNANIEKELVGASIIATEHSIQSALTSADGDRDEYDAYKYLITEACPQGFMSIVSDTYDFWKVVGEVIPRLKNEIMSRDGKVVIRPDSGNPVDIICGNNIEDITSYGFIKNLDDAKSYMKDSIAETERDETPHGEHGDCNPSGEFKYDGKYYRMVLDIMWDRYDKQYYYMDEVDIESFEEFTPTNEDLGLIESLWNIFGGTVTPQGYKVLDSHIGAIYGDSITLERAKQIVSRLEAKGFASTNIVLGVGSYTYQHVTRDTLGFAMKATYAVIDGEERMLFKDPKTDDGTKRSQRGRVTVFKDGEGNIHYVDGLNLATEKAGEESISNMLETVFEDGELKRDQSLVEIRQILHG